MTTKPARTRRFFLTHLGAGITLFGAGGAGSAMAAQSRPEPRWQASRHAQDDWFDQIPGQHRLIFDTTVSAGMSSATMFANNFYIANNSGYGLQNGDLAVVIVARHTTTPFAYNDSIWAKYGVPISNFVDNTKEPLKANPYTRQLNGLIGRGVHLAVCQMATRAIAGAIARAVSGSTDDIYNELAANLLPNSHLVSAGIVAVSRAQERGYTLVNGG